MTNERKNALGEGDTVMVGEDVGIGDVVFFERLGPGSVIARVMTVDQLHGFTGSLYTLSAIHPSGQAHFRELSRDELNLV
jgi:hypothetical protein